MRPIFVENTLNKRKEEFIPITPGKVFIYHCGPTVYWTQHIGNMRSVVFGDLVRRMFKINGYKVKFVRNYTDVGHLTGDNIGDADSGEDRMEKASKRESKTPEEIADKYIEIYKNDVKKLNILTVECTPRATENIKEIIEMVSSLLGKGFAYETELAVYFDTSKYKDYTRLSGQSLRHLSSGAGTGAVEDKNKRNPNDFSLWFFKAGVHQNALQVWESPFKSKLVPNGLGFPGWHIECSAMSKRFLGKHFDIHLGGIEHIPIHHTNEIAQSVCANQSPFVNYWMHNEHLLYENGKISKSGGTAFSLDEVIEKGFDPLSLRYFFLQTHYRSKQNFTWEALASSEKAYYRLKDFVNLNKFSEIYLKISQIIFSNKKIKEYEDKFFTFINDDLNTAGALALIWEIIRDDGLENNEKASLILKFDEFFGLDLKKKNEKVQIPNEVQELIDRRKIARDSKDWELSDKIRKEIEKKGFRIKDTGKGVTIEKI